MKLKSLFLGTIAAAGLSTAGFAADLGVLTSLDVCDALGLSGLTISSDTNCLQITGGISYEGRFGDYRAADRSAQTAFGNGYFNPANTGQPDFLGADSGDFRADGVLIPATGSNDWQSKVEAWVKFVATSDSDFGPAKAVLKIKQRDAYRARNETYDGAGNGALWGDNDGSLIIDEAYVSIGDSTVIMVGKKGSIANFGDSTPFNFLKTFAYSSVDNGVLFDNDDDLDATGGHVIQVVSDLGNGFNVGVALENLDGHKAANAASAGTLIGVVGYTGEAVTAHLTGLVFGVLDGKVDDYGLHAGVTGSFDAFKLRATAGYYHNDPLDLSRFQGLLSAQGTFDMFTVALSGEYQRSEQNGVVDDGYGVGGSIGANVTDTVAINLGARYFNSNFNSARGVNNDAVQVAVQAVAAVTETIKITGEVGAYFNDVVLRADHVRGDDSVYYGSAELAWAPGGGFTSSLKGEVYSNDAYRIQVKAAKSFE